MTKPGWTPADIPDQTGRTVVFTGANSGPGFEAALAFARKGARAIGTSRSVENGQAAALRILSGAVSEVS